MPVVRKYPTQYVVHGSGFNNPEYIVGEPDLQCVEIRRIFGDWTNYIELKGWGFNLPTNATIEEIKIGFWGVGYNAFGGYHGWAEIRLCTSDKSRCWIKGSVEIPNSTCADVQEAYTTLIDPAAFTPSDFNNENFIFVAYGNGDLAIGHYSYIDACYIEITYSVPVVAKRSVGDGITWVYC